MEPEGLDTPVVYPNGISNTMPEDIQLNFLRMICGLENVDMLKPGMHALCKAVDFCSTLTSK